MEVGLKTVGSAQSGQQPKKTVKVLRSSRRDPMEVALSSRAPIGNLTSLVQYYSFKESVQPMLYLSGLRTLLKRMLEPNEIPR